MAHSQSAFRVTVVGATSAVGQQIIGLLECANPNQRIIPIDSAPGEHHSIHGDRLNVRLTDTFDFSHVDLAFFAVGPAVSQQLAHRARTDGCTIIDSSSHFRLLPDVPLVIPSINGSALGSGKLIASPHFATAVMLRGLAPFHARYRVRQLAVTIWLSIPADDFDSLGKLEGSEPQQHSEIANAVVNETRKILFPPISADPPMTVEVTPVPGRRKLANVTALVTAEMQETITPSHAREVFHDTAGVRVIEDSPRTTFQHSIPDTIGVGRFSGVNRFGDHGLAFWICDNQPVRRAAFNAVEIAEHIFGGDRLVLQHPRLS